MRNNGNCVSCGGEVYPASNRCAQCGIFADVRSNQAHIHAAGRFDDWCRVAYFAVPVILLMMWRY